jgi:hypothetical protein
MNVDSDSNTAIDDPVVYRKSGSGVVHLAATHGGSLSPRERQVLILLDGRRTIEELSQFFGAEAVCSLIASLEAKGFARRVDDASLPTEWAESVMRFQSYAGAFEPPADEPSTAASRWHHDWFALINLAMLVVVIATVTGLWLIERF